MKRVVNGLADRLNEAIHDKSFRRDRMSDEIERLKAAGHVLEKYNLYNMTPEDAEALLVIAKLIR